MNIILGVVLLAIGFRLSAWMGKYSGRNAFFAPLIFRSVAFSMFLTIFIFGSLLAGIYFVFKGSWILGSVIAGFYLFTVIKSHFLFKNKNIAIWVFKAYKEYKRIYPKESEEEIFERVFKKQFENDKTMSQITLETWSKDPKNVKDLADRIIMLKKEEEVDMSNFDKWLARSNKRDKDIQEAYDEVFEGKEKGKRYVPIITGVVELLVGIWFTTLGSIFSWVGIFLLIIGLSGLRTGIFGSQKLVDEMTLGKSKDLSQESKEELKKTFPL